MQFTTFSVAFFGALATATQHVPQHFHHRRGLNGSGVSTTLTVYQTQIYTITSCAASITNCPARASASTSETVITDIIAITTTVCPVEEAESASSQALESYSATATATASAAASSTAAGVVTVPSIPLGTGASAGSGAQATGGPSGSESVVLTYTLGSGTSTTIVTTTIKHTQVTTVYATQAAETGGAAGISGNEAAAEQTDITTTITGTSTSTRYITVMPVSSGSSALGQVGASGLANNAASGETSCAPQVTVTVFQAVSTVTVTETASPACSTSASSGGISSGNVSTGADEQVAAPSVEGAASSPSVVVIVSTALVVPLPVSTGAPYSNGTDAGSSKKPCSSLYPSSGFISKAKATGTAPIKSATASGW